MITGRYANVIVDISHEKVDRPFQYKIPERLMGKLSPGMCVEIPFGNGSRFRQGYVIEVTDKPEYAPEKQKEIAGIVQGGVSMQADQIRLAAWIRETYGSTMIAALKTVLPVRQERKQKEKKKIVRCLGAEETMALLGQAQRKHQTAKVRVLEQLCREEILPYELVSGKLNVSPATLRSLESQGVIRVEAESYYRNPVKLNAEAEEGKQLSEEQRAVRDQVLSDYDQGKNKTYLIHGITGSGKTEVYLAIIEGMIKRGKQCIVLIPEIALTYQTLLRFYKRFGDRVSVMNSSLSAGEKYDQCERARKGEIDVIIGPRSALFVPFENLGLVVIDEEHEGSYKSESMPRYHARETARYLADLKGRTLITTDGTTLLGADDKAGIAEVLTVVDEILKEGLPHGKICIGFTPDEEIARGAKHFDVEGFGADYGYTLDGSAEGEIQYENFNASTAFITIHGVSVHTGTAKDVLVNSQTIGTEFHQMLPVSERPETTEGYEGFYHLVSFHGNVTETKMKYFIRDFDTDGFHARASKMQEIAGSLNEKYGAGTVEIEIVESYYNMREKIEPCMQLIEYAKKAAENADIVPDVAPIRGGTDGARLSFKGLPCPNLGTGGYAFHGVYEHITVEGMDKAVVMVKDIVGMFAK